MRIRGARARDRGGHVRKRCSSIHLRLALEWVCLLALAGGLRLSAAQSEKSEPAGPPAPRAQWIFAARIKGHLVLRGSPAGAFSRDSRSIAIISGHRVLLTGLNSKSQRRFLQPGVKGVIDLEIQSASFVSPDRLLILAAGRIAKRPSYQTPLLAFLWSASKDGAAGKAEEIATSGGFGPAVFFPRIGFLVIPKKNYFTLWNPVTGRVLGEKVPELTRPAQVFDFSPNGQWLLLAQIEGNAFPDPVVVQLKGHRFVDILKGHTGPVTGMNFSRDSSKVVTACTDGRARIYSAPGWKLLETLSGHAGPVRWAEFSPDGRTVVSAGDDGTVRVWSAEDGQLLETLTQPRSSVRTAAFSPNGEWIAATTNRYVYLWQKTHGGQ